MGGVSAFLGLRLMEGEVSGTRQRAFFQSVCPASRPRVTGTGLIKWLDITAQRLGHAELKCSLMGGCTAEQLRTLNATNNQNENSHSHNCIPLITLVSMVYQ